MTNCEKMAECSQTFASRKALAALIPFLLLFLLLASLDCARTVKKQFVVIAGHVWGSAVLNGTDYADGTSLEVRGYGKTEAGEPYVLIRAKSGAAEAYPLKYFTGVSGAG